MRITTENGSIYEVDTDSKRVRRLNETPSRSKHFQADDWATYADVREPTIGFGLYICWGGTKVTVTSPVTEIRGTK